MKNLVTVTAVMATNTNDIWFTEHYESSPPEYIDSVFRSFERNGFNIVHGTFTKDDDTAEFFNYEDFYTILSNCKKAPASKSL